MTLQLKKIQKKSTQSPPTSNGCNIQNVLFPYFLGKDVGSFLCLGGKYFQGKLFLIMHRGLFLVG